MVNLLTTQYAFVQSARAALLRYCSTLPAADFRAPVPEFIGKSMRDLLVHVADTYRGWLGAFGFVQLRQPLDPAHYASFGEVFALFENQVDPLVALFTHHFAGQPHAPLTHPLPGAEAPTLTLTPLQLLTHVVTHEFHHKGQIMTMGRLLGYQPPDTDVIRFG